jgi:hypothetical protein
MTLLPGAAKSWTTRIGPDIGLVAAISTELNIIAVRALPCLEDEDEFMLRPAEAPHPAIGLRLDAEIEHLENIRPSGGEQLRHMPPIQRRQTPGCGA